MTNESRYTKRPGGPVQEVDGIRIALRDLITRAGDGDLLGGRLETAIADDSPSGTSIILTLGTKKYIVSVKEWDEADYNAWVKSHYRTDTTS